jgi:hypothetical protein
MRRTLALHPDSRCKAVTRIDVDVARPGTGHLTLRYSVTGKIKDVRLPPVMDSERADELWQHTCFEAFVRAPHGAAYCEFNFAPSTRWAAYGFSGYRSGMRVVTEVDAPFIEVHVRDDIYTLQAALDLERLPHLPKDAALTLGVSAVIEETDGTISYWALAHPPGRADFHHSDCFALELARA